MSHMSIFGIRHHGPGSARSLVQALTELRPDAILVEGPPDAEGVLPLLTHEGMTPPVALLVYRPDVPRQAVYYPLARFSPEWQAIRYGLSEGVPVRFMDLPQAHQLAEAPEEEPADGAGPDEAPTGESLPAAGRPTDEAEAAVEPEAALVEAMRLRQDPLRWLAEAAGE
jgi:hypothetical protein